MNIFSNYGMRTDPMLEMMVKSQRTNVLLENKINKSNSKINLNQNKVDQTRNAIDKF